MLEKVLWWLSDVLLRVCPCLLFDDLLLFASWEVQCVVLAYSFVLAVSGRTEEAQLLLSPLLHELLVLDTEEAVELSKRVGQGE